MVVRAFPFPVGSPEEEIEFLIQFVNGDWPVFQSGITETFLHLQRIFGRPATIAALSHLEDEARGYLRAIAARRPFTIHSDRVAETVDATGRVRRDVAPADFSARVRSAVFELARSKRRVRLCDLNQDHFFFPAGRELYCERCRHTRIARAIELEQAQKRIKRFRERRSARGDAERIRLQERRERLIEQLSRNPNNAAVRGRLELAEDRLAVIERAHHGSPPSPPVARWEITLQIGMLDSDVQVNMGAFALGAANSAMHTTDRPLTMAFSGTYAEVLDKYRQHRRAGRTFVA